VTRIEKEDELPRRKLKSDLETENESVNRQKKDSAETVGVSASCVDGSRRNDVVVVVVLQTPAGSVHSEKKMLFCNFMTKNVLLKL
jgi:hypothetical protein